MPAEEPTDAAFDARTFQLTNAGDGHDFGTRARREARSTGARRDSDYAGVVMNARLAAAMIADTGRELRRVVEHLDRPTVLEAMQMDYRPEPILCRCGCIYRQPQGIATYCDYHAPEKMGSLPDYVERDLGVKFVRD